MSSMYGMQRANGDWFALEDKGRLRAPVFHSRDEAMQARSLNAGMLLFTPVALDERALLDLAPKGEELAACFWLVDNASGGLGRGRPVEHAQLALLIRDGAKPAQG